MIYKIRHRKLKVPKVVIRSRKYKDRQYNNQTNRKRTNNDLQNTTHKTKQEELY